MPFHPGILFSVFVLLFCLGVNIASYPDVNGTSRRQVGEPTEKENSPLFAPGFDLDETALRPVKTSNVNRPIPLDQSEKTDESTEKSEAKPKSAEQNTAKPETSKSETPKSETVVQKKPEAVKKTEPVAAPNLGQKETPRKAVEKASNTPAAPPKKADSDAVKPIVAPAQAPKKPASAKKTENEQVPPSISAPASVKSTPKKENTLKEENKGDTRLQAPPAQDSPSTREKAAPETPSLIPRDNVPQDKGPDPLSAFAPIVPPSMQERPENVRSDVVSSPIRPLPDPAAPMPEKAEPIKAYAAEIKVDPKPEVTKDPPPIRRPSPPTASESLQLILERPLMPRPTSKVIPLPPSAETLPKTRPLPPLSPLDSP